MKYHIIFVIGFFLTILPFVGIPTTWKMIIIGVIGAVLMLVSLVKYYSAYSAQEFNQTFTDSDPSSNQDSDAQEEPREEKFQHSNSKPQPSPFYDYSQDKVHNRIQYAEIKVTRRLKNVEENQLIEEDDLADESYAKKNRYEEEHVF